jgi:hypothetical protein
MGSRRHALGSAVSVLVKPGFDVAHAEAEVAPDPARHRTPAPAGPLINSSNGDANEIGEFLGSEQRLGHLGWFLSTTGVSAGPLESNR